MLTNNCLANAETSTAQCN